MQFDLDIPNLTEYNIQYGKKSFQYAAGLQARSTFPFHIHFHVLDANGLRDYILLHSQYNLVTDDMSSIENYFIRENQSISDIPTDILTLIIPVYGNELTEYKFSNQLLLEMNVLSMFVNLWLMIWQVWRV